MPNRYKTIAIKKTESGVRYYTTVVYPDIPVHEDDIYIITTGLDRYDILAQQYYGDSSLWWVIATANTAKRDGLMVKPGIQLRIPTNPNRVKQLFIDLNKDR